MSPTPSSTSTVMGLGVSNVGIMGVLLGWWWCRVSVPSRCGAGRPAARGARAVALGVGAPEGGGGGPDEPGVHRQALLPRRALDRRLEPIGHAHVDAPQRAVVVLGCDGRNGGLGALLGDGLAGRRRDDELGVTTAQAQLDRARGELHRDLLGGSREDVLEVQEQGGLERGDEPLGDGAGLLTPGLGGQEQVAADVLDIWIAGSWHHYGTLLMPMQGHRCATTRPAVVPARKR